jgi:MFS family permease
MSLLFEVPTGAIADHWSRRKMLILSGFFYSTCYAIWAFSGSFWLFLLGFLFRTLGSTFASGTLQAYVYDFLKINHQAEGFEKIWGKGNALRTLGIGVAVLCGGFLSGISYMLTSIASSLSILTISVIAFMLPEIPPVTSTEEGGYWRFLKNSVKTVRDNNYLLKIVAFSGITLSIFASLEEFNDVYLKFLGYPNFAIGIIFAIATAGQSVASVVAHKFKNHSWKVLNAITAIGFIILMSAAFIKHPIMAAAILFLGILLEFSRVLNEGVIQREVPPNQRATVASLNSFIHNLIPFQLLFGVIANTYRLQLSYAVFGAAILLYFLFLPLLNRSKKVVVD